MKKVLISSSFKRQIAKEFDCSLVTIEMAYKYVTNSEKAQNIRQRAKELQQMALNEIVIDTKDLK
jgi:CO dehydrogenase nickel-insertion accessory protein CooC1